MNVAEWLKQKIRLSSIFCSKLVAYSTGKDKRLCLKLGHFTSIRYAPNGKLLGNFFI